MLTCFLVYYENLWLDKCLLQFKSKYYGRYIDDMFLMFEKKDHVKRFLKYMNSRHQNIKFTFDEERNNNITFLDISITRVGNKLQTSLCWKRTFSGVYLNLNTHLPSEQKRGCYTPCCTVHRAYNICSNYFNFQQEIVYLKSVWQKKPFLLLINMFIRFLTTYF